MIKIVICDDDTRELDRTSKKSQAYLAGHPEEDIRICSFSSPLEVMQNIERGEIYDIYLLDIYMPQMTGTELAKSIRKSKEDCQIIFLTSSMSHAIEAFSLHATHYLVKPYTGEQLADALHKAVRAIGKRNKAQITVKTSDGMQRVSFSDFIYSETDKHTQQIYLTDGKCHQVRISSTELFELLSFDRRFFKCGSTYIINVSKVEQITRSHIIFETGRKIPMQRRQYKDLVDRYAAYVLEGF